MLKWLLTRIFGPDPRELKWARSVSERIQRLEIAQEENFATIQAVWARQRKVEGAVHGMRGASARWPERDPANETFEQFRDRMVKEGRLGVVRGENHHGEH